ncbi:hypothetical protein AO385_0730 [Moraxella catarrhalis]|uniref:Uncharacterized protein n=1 Tax=Moraxella catarrhalis TaxID=480 RepID=A0A198UN62_MORCA|nr:hypothetical protein AO383_1738 [Moraxella catarrhalis]OAU97933.1 hypothetical protein AO384_0180 [Moraxella catarrhalis]OAV02986.1 hypothetical protein AO385_0730 [Moraxella catarrhalis]
MAAVLKFSAAVDDFIVYCVHAILDRLYGFGWSDALILIDI